MLLVFKTYLSGGWWCLSNSTNFSKMLQFLKNTKIAKKILKKILEVLQACGFYRIPQMVKTTIGIVFNLFQDEEFQQINNWITCVGCVALRSIEYCHSIIVTSTQELVQSNKLLTKQTIEAKDKEYSTTFSN